MSKKKTVFVDRIVKRLKLEQQHWLRVFYLAKSRIVALDAFMKAYQKEKESTTEVKKHDEKTKKNEK